jgi:hypothetical protein
MEAKHVQDTFRQLPRLRTDTEWLSSNVTKLVQCLTKPCCFMQHNSTRVALSSSK